MLTLAELVRHTHHCVVAVLKRGAILFLAITDPFLYLIIFLQKF
jgi:hypothetical protein